MPKIQILPRMFGRATITLGIGPHSSFSLFCCFRYCNERNQLIVSRNHSVQFDKSVVIDIARNHTLWVSCRGCFVDCQNQEWIQLSELHQHFAVSEMAKIVQYYLLILDRNLSVYWDSRTSATPRATLMTVLPLGPVLGDNHSSCS